MTKKNLPNIPIYIGDWERDCNVLSLETEGAWLRIIFKMFTKGKQSVYKIPTKSLQNLWRCDETKMNEIIQELSFNEICPIDRTDDGWIVFKSRRFEKENNISKVRSDAVSNRKDRNNRPTKPLQTHNKKDTKGVQITENEIDYENENEVEIKNESDLKPKIDFQKVADIFNSVCSNLPSVKKITSQRKSAINARVKDYGLNKIGEVFQTVSRNEFLNGNNDRGWTADFDWVMNPNNFIKILEGKYNGKAKKSNSGSSKVQYSDDFKKRIADRLQS